MNWHEYLTEITDKLIVNGVQIVILLILMLISLKLVKLASNKLLDYLISSTDNIESEKKIKTLRNVIKSIFDILIIVVGTMMIIEKLGINIGPILAAAGVVGIAVGFGSQRLVEDVISGMQILATDQVRVGDVVKIGDKSGLVEKVDLRMILLRDFDGSVHFIRNGKIDIITNMTKNFSYYVMDIRVAYEEDLEKVIHLIKQTGEMLMNDERFATDILEPVEVLGLDKFEDSTVIIKARIKTKPIRQWAVGRAFNLALKQRFDEHRIEIPFPRRKLYLSNQASPGTTDNAVNK
ncbi:MAG: mechanosensitive ion channel family protein [Candidatus Gastranaerophilales bacterium]|nr:mechanosensitive ion channel family protein [Candidatus Gastranaerophilales bacterium]